MNTPIAAVRSRHPNAFTTSDTVDAFLVLVKRRLICVDMASGRRVNWQDEFLETSARLADLRQ